MTKEYKNYILKNLFFIVITAIAFSCDNPESLKGKQKTILQGKIVNNSTDEIRIENDDTTFTSTVNKNGEFLLDFEISKPGFYTYIGNEFTTIYIQPGDSIFLHVDAQGWRSFDSTLKFSGNGGNINNYFFKKELKLYDTFYSGLHNYFKLEESEFISLIDSVYLHYENSFNEYIKINKVDEPTIELERNNLLFFKINNLLNYSDYYSDKPEMPNLIMEQITYELNNLDLNNEGFLILDSYKKVIVGAIKYIAYTTNHDNDVLLNRLIYTERLITNEKVKKQAIKGILTNYLRKFKITEAQLTLVKEKCDSNTIKFLSDEIIRNTPLKDGQIAPDFELIDSEGNIYTLNDFRGKYIYIDVWTSYCGSCLREAPYFEKLKEIFKDDRIVFINVSLDRKETEWLRAIEKYNFKGLQLKAKDDWSSGFAKDYSVDHYGTPHYILIDKNGTILEARANKPSKIEEQLHNLLN